MFVRLEGAVTRGARNLSKAGLLLLISFAACTLLDGLARTFLHYPIDAVRDLGGLVTAVAISCCFPQGFLEGANIVISLIDGFIPARAVRILETFAAVMTLVVVALFACAFLRYTLELDRAGEITPLLELPVAPFWYVVDANLWLTMLVQLIVTARTACLREIPAKPERHSAL